MRNDVSMPRLLNAREVAELLGVPLYTLRDQ